MKKKLKAIWIILKHKSWVAFGFNDKDGEYMNNNLFVDQAECIVKTMQNAIDEEMEQSKAVKAAKGIINQLK